jgi:type II secretory pathway pseudopilin PulG
MASNAHINLRRLRLPVTAVVGVAALAVAGWVPAQLAAAEQAAAQAAEGLAPTAFRGFVLSNGRYTKFDVPGTTTKTTVGGSNDRGQLVGFYTQTGLLDDPSSPRRGYLLDRGRFVRIGFHGFVWERGRFTTIDAPGAVGTFVSDINNRGQIVGSAYRDPGATAGRGFLLAKGPRGAFTPINFPGAANTVVAGINDRGLIVGAYQNATAAPGPAAGQQFTGGHAA